MKRYKHMTALRGKTRLVMLTGAALLSAGCATTPPSEDPVLIKLDELDGRLDRVERVVNNDSLIQLAAQLDELQLEVRQLRGDVETLRFDTESASARQRDQYLDIDRRLQNLAVAPGAMSSGPANIPSTGGSTPTGAAVGGAVGAGAVVAAGSADGSDRVLYQQSFDLLKDGRYDEARGSFKQFLEQYPESPLAGNGQYWMAETFYVGQDFSAALPEFQKVVDQYPTTRKVSDALLKIGYCQYELEQYTEAKAALGEVTTRYPETTAARLARQRLAQMASEGR
jgi:tol-pal system protein YbgF